MFYSKNEKVLAVNDRKSNLTKKKWCRRKDFHIKGKQICFGVKIIQHTVEK